MFGNNNIFSAKKQSLEQIKENLPDTILSTSDIPDSYGYVTCFDRCLSGWGYAAKRKNKLVFPVPNAEIAELLEHLLRSRSEMRYINFTTRKPALHRSKQLIQVKDPMKWLTLTVRVTLESHWSNNEPSKQIEICCVPTKEHVLAALAKAGHKPDFDGQTIRVYPLASERAKSFSFTYSAKNKSQ